MSQDAHALSIVDGVAARGSTLRDRDAATRGAGGHRAADAERPVRGRHDELAHHRPVAQGNLHRRRRTAAGRSDRWYPAAARARWPSARAVPARGAGRRCARSRACFRAREPAFDALEHVSGRTRSWMRAPVATAAGCRCWCSLPGIPAIPSSHTALLEDLASHGYAVLSIVHPYEATAATLADGRVVTMLDRRRHRCCRRSPEVISEWRTEDETMAAVTRRRKMPPSNCVSCAAILAGLHQDPGCAEALGR